MKVFAIIVWIVFVMIVMSYLIKKVYGDN